MRPISQYRMLCLTSLAVPALIGCASQPSLSLILQPTEQHPTQDSNFEPGGNSLTSIDAAKIPPISSSGPLEASPVNGGKSLLSPRQIEQLMALPIPVVVPDDIPEGFRVTAFEADSIKYADGSDDAGYSITYRNEDNRCFVIYTNKGGTRGLEQLDQVESTLGTVKIYTDRHQTEKSFSGFFPVGNGVMVSPFSSLNPATEKYEACQPLDLSEYKQILKSIRLVSHD